MDGCLLTTKGMPNYDVIETYRFFEKMGHTMVIWSGSGIDYVKTKLHNQLGLVPHFVCYKGDMQVDVAFDDEVVELGAVNIQVK